MSRSSFIFRSNLETISSDRFSNDSRKSVTLNFLIKNCCKKRDLRSVVIADELLDVLLVGELSSSQFDLELLFLVTQNFFMSSHFCSLLFQRIRVVHSKLSGAVLVLVQKLLRLLLVHLKEQLAGEKGRKSNL